jgi:acetyltransferase-like isoleucine patch superfamily enzyme
MLKGLLKLISRKLKVSESYFISENRKYDAFEVGEGSYGYPEIEFYDAGAKLRIGKYCAIAPKVKILLGGEHHLDWVSGYPFSLLNDKARDLSGYPFTKGDVTIGNDVWIGYDALILSGVTIGDGAVIGARSLVTKDIEPFAVVGGVPGKLIRYRFSKDTIASLQKIAWWNWPRKDIEAAWHLIQSPNVDDFVNAFTSDRKATTRK